MKGAREGARAADGSSVSGAPVWCFELTTSSELRATERRYPNLLYVGGDLDGFVRSAK
jgi:hypothetical protein